VTLTPGYEPPALATRMMRGECARMGRVHNGYDATQGDRIEEDPTGLLNEGFRYRDLATGSFITRDPLVG